MRRRLLVTGQVQGVGFRPWVVRKARQLDLVGCVRNGAEGVWIEVQGEALDAFVDALRCTPPPIDARIVRDEVVDDVDEGRFAITESSEAGERRPTLPPDLATCERCLAELDTVGDRRQGYGLLSCVACGPRYSLAGPPPFDRDRTAMSAFVLCPACQGEYDDPGDRRYHAQATACAACGPRLSMSLDDAAEVVRSGGVLALKGTSGFQLVCNAGDEQAVRRLRELKGRPDKPLAVMSPGAPDGGGPEAPIVLCEAELEVAPSVLSGTRWIGWMRPTTGVHHQLLKRLSGPIVCTSANRSGEPLATEASQVHELCDAVLDHDRPIWRAADDSVVTEIAGRLRVLRRARGYAPRPLPIGADGPVLLALGADLKSTVTLALGREAVMSPHLGTLGSRPMLERLKHEIGSLCTVYAARPQQIVCDAHPDLVSSRMAEELAKRWDVPVLRVYHHHAHIAAVCAEQRLEGPVLGFAWDGVGLGPDGGTWGGELLLVDGGRFERLAHLEPFALPGGDACAREPGRTAVSLLHAAGLDNDERLHPWASQLWQLLAAMPRRCTSMGRLFDGIAVLAGVPPEVTWEAQLPLALQQAAASVGPVEPWPLVEGAPLDWRPWVRSVVADREPLPVVASRLHETLVAALVTLAEQHDGPVVLAGGCFQNRLLVEGVVARLGDRVVLAEQVPPGDGGISLGQAWIARRS